MAEEPVKIDIKQALKAIDDISAYANKKFGQAGKQLSGSLESNLNKVAKLIEEHLTDSFGILEKPAKAVFTALGESAEKAISIIKRKMPDVTDEINAWKGKIAGFYSGMTLGAENVVGSVKNKFSDLGNSMLTKAKETYMPFLPEAKNIFNKVATVIGTVAAKFDVIKAVSATVWAPFAPKLKEAAETVKPIISAVGAGLKSGISVACNAAGKAVSALGPIFTALAKKAGEVFMKMMSFDTMKGVFSTIGDGIEKVAKGFGKITGLSATFKEVKEGILETIGGNAELKASLENIKASLLSAFEPIITAVMPIFNALLSLVANGAKTISDLVGKMFSVKVDTAGMEAGVTKVLSIKDMVVNVFHSIGKVVVEGVNMLAQLAPNLAQTAVQIITALIAGFQGNFETLKTAALSIAQVLLEGFAQILPQLAPLATTIITTLIEGLLLVYDQLVPAGISLVTKVMEGIAAKLPELIPQAKDTIIHIVTAISDNLPMMLESGTKIIMSLMEGIVQLIPQLIPQAQKMLTTLINGIKDNLPQILDSGIQILLSLIDGISGMLPELIPMAMKMILTIIEGLIKNLDKIFASAIKLLTSLADGVIDALPILVEKAPAIINDLIKGIIENLPKLLNAAVEIVGKLASYIVNNLGDIAGSAMKILVSLANGLIQFAAEMHRAAKEMVGKLIQKIKDTDWIQVGKDILKSIISGIGNIGSSIVNGVKDFGSWLKNGIPFLAKGGIVRQPTLAMIGEAGAEAVVPLEKNTGGLDKLAQMLSDYMQPTMNTAVPDGGELHVHLNVGNREITETVIDGIWGMIQESGRNPLPQGG